MIVVLTEITIIVTRRKEKKSPFGGFGRAILAGPYRLGREGPFCR